VEGLISKYLTTDGATKWQPLKPMSDNMILSLTECIKCILEEEE
jgi:hypothetical protein